MPARLLVACIGAVVLSGAAGAVAATGQPWAAPWIRWDGVTEVAAGGGEKGPWRQNASHYDYVDDPAVAFDAAGALSLAWVDQNSKDVFFQKFFQQKPGPGDGARRAAPLNVSRSPATFSWLPRIATAPGEPQKIYLLWQEIIFSGGSHGGDILFARSSDGGAGFDAPLNLSRSRGGDGKGRIDRDSWSNGSLDVAAGPDGAVLAAWTEYDGMLWMARSGDGGATFTRPYLVAGEPGRPARGPSLALGASGAVALAWTVGEDPSARIRVAHSPDGGAGFDAPQLVGAGGAGYADAPKIAFDAGGTLHLVYSHSDGGRFGRHHVRYARSPAGSARFGAPRVIGPAPRGGSAAFPALGVDGEGRLCVLWEVLPDGAPAARGLALTCSRDGGRSFAPPVPVPASADPAGGANGSAQGVLANKLAVDGDGRIAIVNSSLKPGARSRVWLVRGQLAPGWTSGAAFSRAAPARTGSPPRSTAVLRRPTRCRPAGR